MPRRRIWFGLTTFYLRSSRDIKRHSTRVLYERPRAYVALTCPGIHLPPHCLGNGHSRTTIKIQRGEVVVRVAGADVSSEVRTARETMWVEEDRTSVCHPSLRSVDNMAQLHESLTSLGRPGARRRCHSGWQWMESQIQCCARARSRWSALMVAASRETNRVCQSAHGMS
ncbi:hypothetical protein L210DRAFT_2174994 [Boletus edulis BED1]|uniref:Uncharacterized protein n=1 Tax=Boletus edulis BED1 TaxID=1328754 RepID=A0AAD4GEA4_BOLED|nr:hypothetical protein L210DRAFT_2174994 [Boletus edulis BED1]